MSTYAPKVASERIATALRDRKPLRVLGAEGALRGRMLAAAAMDAEAGPPVVYVAGDDAAAREVAIDAAFFMGAPHPAEQELDGSILVLPELDVSPYADVSPDPRVVAARLAALTRLRQDDGPRLVIGSLRSFMRRAMPATAFDRLRRQWSEGDEIDRDDAIALLLDAGYIRADVVEDPGTFAVRGAVMDIYVPRLRFPVRIEWFGDEIERMRLFDPDSQRSLRRIESAVIHPVRETIRTAEVDLRARVLAIADTVHAPSSRSRQVVDNVQRGMDFFGVDALTPIFHEQMDPIWTYLPEGARWLVEEPDALAGLATRLQEELQTEYERATGNHMLAAAPQDFAVTAPELLEHLRAQPVVASRTDLYDPERSDDRPVVRIAAERNPRLKLQLESARKQKGGELLRPLVRHIRELGVDEDGTTVAPWTVLIAAPNLTHAERLSSLLRGYGLTIDPPRLSEGAPPVLEGPAQGPTRVQVVAGELSAGYESADDRVMLLSEADLFGRITRRSRKRRRRIGIGSLSQLGVGDYVVHVTHGIGRYTGLTKLTLDGIPGDFVFIEYAGTDRLYLPVYRLGEIERYVSAEAKPPRLDKMGGSTFATKTAKVKAEVRQIAEELLQIYAQREAMHGHAFAEGGELYAAFESTFPFEETPDQQEAIDAVHDDLGRERPMDRLVCGDVGFGKTEVALRAAFRVALSGKQVAVLAPTTVLVQQHFHTFRERMESFGIRVERLNRLTDAATRKKTVAGLRDGTVDVVIGTHRLLSKDVRPSNLGLVIIDEEQRFGVAQKERFKKLKTQVDVLTLTATPIPRTLHMSLLGIREISLIMTPPVDRLAVRTMLTRPSDAVLEEGIQKELARGGQVFYVVPKVQGIEEHARRLRELVPEARVIVAHGQMPAAMLEKAMIDFVEHQADVLVSTTIIESGLDIPRANTMFIARADMFGLSQLYQLRGRIGRSKHRAYCYLMVQSLEKLQPEARRRLEAVVRFSELGSGFNVASQDLEIRGAGDILGARQSGQIQAIGFEAYSRILAEAVAELKGQPIVRETDPEITFDVPAFLPDTYVEDTGQRLDLYRRFSDARDREDVDALMEELRDRFGDPPEEAVNLGYVMACKAYGRRLEALSLELRGPKLSVRLSPETPLSPQAAAALTRRTDGQIRLAPGDRIVITLPTDKRRLEHARNALSTLLTHT